jgi:DNA gyrase/topoisomerase IV subunit B
MYTAAQESPGCTTWSEVVDNSVDEHLAMAATSGVGTPTTR